MLADDVRALLDHYPKIFFACHSRHVRDPGAGHQVSTRQVSILDHLDETTAITLSTLARHSGVTPSTMSLAIDRLEQLGYVKREKSPEDARRIGLTLTPAGGRIRDAQSVLDPECVRAMLGHLTQEQRARAIEGLALLAQAAQSHMHQKAGDGPSAVGSRLLEGDS